LLDVFRTGDSRSVDEKPSEPSPEAAAAPGGVGNAQKPGRQPNRQDCGEVSGAPATIHCRATCQGVNDDLRILMMLLLALNSGS
jgi:hypothetical protein